MSLRRQLTYILSFAPERGFLASLWDYAEEGLYQVTKGVEKAGTAVTDRWKEWDYEYTVRTAKLFQKQ
jgi:hypothetical protein